MNTGAAGVLSAGIVRQPLASVPPPHDILICRPGDAPDVHDVLVRYGAEDDYLIHESPYLPDGTALVTFSQAAFDAMTETTPALMFSTGAAAARLRIRVSDPV